MMLLLASLTAVSCSFTSIYTYTLHTPTHSVMQRHRKHIRPLLPCLLCMCVCMCVCVHVFRSSRLQNMAMTLPWKSISLLTTGESCKRERERTNLRSCQGSGDKVEGWKLVHMQHYIERVSETAGGWKRKKLVHNQRQLHHHLPSQHSPPYIQPLRIAQSA